jgi:nitrogen fixation/metabolism regulation signal transduction histidine kinase
MTNETLITIIAGIVLLGIAIICFAGYVYNIIKVARTNKFSGMLALRLIGIFFPLLGIILGFIGNKETE